MKSGRLLWGIFWILLGCTYLAVSGGYVSESALVVLITLWPVALILLGLNFILKDRWVFAAVGFLVLVGTFAAALYQPSQLGLVGTNQKDTVQTTQTRLEALEKRIELTVDTGAVALDVHEMTEEQSLVDDVFVEGRNLTGSISVSRDITDGVAKLVISEIDKGSRRADFDPLVIPRNVSKRSVKILVNRNLPLTVTLRSGAANEKLDFSKARLEKLVVKSGAVNSQIRLGSENGAHKIEIESGASNYKLLVPKDVGYRAVSNSGLTNISFPGGSQVVNGEMEKKSANYESSLSKYDITLRSGLTNLEIATY